MKSTILKNMRVFWWPFIIFITLTTTFITIGEVTLDSILLAFSLSLAASIGCLYNDMCDRECDSINKNNGNGHKISKEHNKKYILVLSSLTIMSIILSLSVSVEATIYTALTIILITIYNHLQYKTPASIILSSVTAITPILLPIVLWVDIISITQIIFIVAILILTISREMVADINDYQGDLAGGKKTLAVVIGPTKTKLFVKIIAIFMVILLGTGYLLIVEKTAIQIIFTLVFITTTLFVTFSDTSNKSYIQKTRYIALITPFLFL